MKKIEKYSEESIHFIDECTKEFTKELQLMSCKIASERGGNKVEISDVKKALVYIS